MYRLSLFIFALFFQIVQAQSSEDHSLHKDIYFEATDGVPLRLAYVPANSFLDDFIPYIGPRKVVVFVRGRTSCVENNYDLALRLAGYTLQDSKTSFPGSTFIFGGLIIGGTVNLGGVLKSMMGSMINAAILIPLRRISTTSTKP